MSDPSAGMTLTEASPAAFHTGPPPGQRMPDFTLHDHRDVPVNFTQARAGRRALVHFFRTVSW